jgi:hypothetical protein
MIEEIYLLSVHEPYESHDHPVPINATIVHAKTLLHRQCRNRMAGGCIGA